MAVGSAAITARSSSSSKPVQTPGALAESQAVQGIVRYVEYTLLAQQQSAHLVPFLERLARNVNVYCGYGESGPHSVGVRALVMAVALLQRGITLTVKSVHMHFMVAVLVGIKTLEDRPISNRVWSRLVGCAVHELNQLELIFCKQIHFRLHVNKDQYRALHAEICTF